MALASHKTSSTSKGAAVTEVAATTLRKISLMSKGAAETKVAAMTSRKIISPGKGTTATKVAMARKKNAKWKGTLAIEMMASRKK